MDNKFECCTSKLFLEVEINLLLCSVNIFDQRRRLFGPTSSIVLHVSPFVLLTLCFGSQQARYYDKDERNTNTVDEHLGIEISTTFLANPTANKTTEDESIA